jgi:hypothetical protein
VSEVEVELAPANALRWRGLVLRILGSALLLGVLVTKAPDFVSG